MPLPRRLRLRRRPRGRVVADGADPWVVQHRGELLYAYSSGDAVLVRRPASLEDLTAGPTAVAWQPQGLHHLWAPELHRLDGRWWLYVAADRGDNASHRMHVLVADDPLGPYEHLGVLGTADDGWAIDGTVLEHPTGRVFVWSGWPGRTDSGEQRLYAARMSSPAVLTGERVCLAAPTLTWERHGLPVLEGPTALRRDGQTVLVYSASHSTTDRYCLGRLDLVGDDPLDPAAWVKAPSPVLAAGHGEWGPGHASFVFDDDEHGWIAYHTARRRGSGWDRQVRVAPVLWRPSGELVIAPRSS